MYKRVVSKAQYRWLYSHRSNMRAKGLHYDSKRGLTIAKIDYLLKTTDFDTLPERSPSFTQGV
jgi:hypothetical protein